MSEGFKSSHTISTMRRPALFRHARVVGVGGGDRCAPGSVKPSVSATEVIVEAVPITMQWPNERAMPFLHFLPVALGDRAGAQLRPVFPRVGTRAERLAVPVAAQHRAPPACR
jgi:hypothetical protein